MTMRIAVLGQPSVGKSSVIKYLEKVFGDDALVVSEAARDYIQEFGGIKTIHDQLNVTKIQIQRETSALQSNPKILLCDTPIFNSLPYAKTYFCHNEKDYATYCEIVRLVADHKYDLILWCNPIGNYEQDGVRYQKEDELPYLQEEIRENMYLWHKGNIITLPTTVSSRECFLSLLVTLIRMKEYDIKLI